MGIARALLKDTPILLMDEPVASQDQSKSNEIAAAISALTRRNGHPVTVISSSHNIAFFESFNWALVLANRRLAEAGPVADLMAKRGLYFQLISDQGGVTLDSSGRAKLDVEKLRNVWLFADAPLPAMQKLAPLFTSRRCGTGEVLYADGEAVDTVYLIVSGRVDLVKPTSPDAPTEGEKLRTLEAGCVLMEEALLGDVVAGHSAVAECPCVVLSLPRIHFENVLQSIPGLSEAVMEVAGDRRDAIAPKGLRSAWPLSTLGDDMLAQLSSALPPRRIPTGRGSTSCTQVQRIGDRMHVARRVSQSVLIRLPCRLPQLSSARTRSTSARRSSAPRRAPRARSSSSSCAVSELT